MSKSQEAYRSVKAASVAAAGGKAAWAALLPDDRAAVVARQIRAYLNEVSFSLSSAALDALYLGLDAGRRADKSLKS